MSMAWTKTKDKGKAYIAKLSDEAREKAEAETRASNKSNAARRVAEEAVPEIRVSTEVKRAKRERGESESSSKVESEMKEKAERTRKARESKAKAEAETVETARAWDEDKAKEKLEIVRFNINARGWARAKAEARVRETSNDVQRAAAEARRGQGRNSMLQVGWHWRLPPISGPVPISGDQIEIRQSLRQGRRLRLRYGERWIRRGMQGRQRRRLRLRLCKGQGCGPRQSQRRRRRSLG